MATFARPLGLAILLCLSSFSGLAVGSEEFSETHEAETFSSGWSTIVWAGDENATHFGQIYYPSNVSGLGEPIDNTSGPYPLLIWVGDEGESRDQYDWLGIELASAGYITMVLPPDWNSGETQSQCISILNLLNRLEYNNQNGSFDGDPANMRDAFDLDYWGIGGHGLGAKQAAQCQLVMTGVWEQYITNPPPTALIALGLEDAFTDIPDEYLGPPPKPGMGLYLTGGMDDIAKADTNVEQWLADHDIPWHYMSVIQGNHLQYQDEDTFWERFNDGDAQISREEQQSHALEHIIPYLDLMLKGDHTQWLNATNREVNWQTPSDSISYIYEDLSGSRFMPMDANDSDVNEMEGLSGRVVSVGTTVTHRNGALPTGSTVICTIAEGGDWWDPMDYATYGINATGTFTGSVDNGNASSTDCEVSTEGVPPGNRTVVVDVNWYGMPSYLELNFFRNNREPVLVMPTPTIEVPQHGSTSMPFSDFVVDPDGTTLIVEMSPHLPSVNQMHCFLEVNAVVCEHTGEPEWTGTETLNLTIFDRYDLNHSTQINLSATVFAVDDPIVQISEIPDVYMVEDDSIFGYTVTSHFEDPEGSNVTIENATATEGLELTWTENNVAIEPLPNWHGSTMVEVWVSDGTSNPVLATFMVDVASVSDPPRLNLTRVLMTEDTPLEIPLSELGWDEDGDTVEFEIMGDHPYISATVLSNVLRIEPTSHWSGLSTGWNLTATSIDGNQTVPIEFEVSEVNDALQLTWGPLDGQEFDVSFTFAIHDPDDDMPWMMRTRWDGVLWGEDFEAPCSPSDASLENPQDWECTVAVSTTDLLPGAHRLEVQVYENGIWSEEKIYYHTIGVPEPEPTDGNDLTEISLEEGDGLISIWVVFAIIVAIIVGAMGIYMVITLSKDDMEEMLGDISSQTYTSQKDEFAELEVDLDELD